VAASTHDLHVLRVFCAADGSGGNPLGVFLGGAAIAAKRRQAIAHRLGFPETVFVEEAGRIRIFTPEVELPLAGHPLVGTAWLLREVGEPVAALHPPAGEVAVRYAGAETLCAGRPEWGPPFEFVELESAAEVEALEGAPAGRGWVAAWAWLDESRGLIRARVFADAGGIAEDEATGSAAMRLAAEIGREIEIQQGRGSVVLARPLADGRAEIGGRVVLDEVKSPVAAGAW
jgi:predicted PhzF superfamily epimerase YddE/YHI9